MITQFIITLENDALTTTIARDGVLTQTMHKSFPNQAADKLHAQLLSFFFAMINLYAEEQKEE